MSEVTILVVDDADSTRETIKDVLEEKGYRVLTAEDGVEALRIIEEVGCCDIVLLDLVIPKMDGIEVLRRIKERNCEIEVIIITGFADLDSAIAAVNEGAFGYVQKPVDFRLLDRYIEELLEKQQMRRSLIESEERYRTLFESSPDGIFLLKDVIIECNSEMSRLLGHKMEDIIGRPLS
ncbi:MAG TPA: response regulator, partial [Candidatus Syntrophoarchaeum butanivorans]|nr:response regulator [Candidatus Syntrophoarchaeum butanivorans]